MNKNNSEDQLWEKIIILKKRADELRKLIEDPRMGNSEKYPDLSITVLASIAIHEFVSTIEDKLDPKIEKLMISKMSTSRKGDKIYFTIRNLPVEDYIILTTDSGIFVEVSGRFNIRIKSTKYKSEPKRLVIEPNELTNLGRKDYHDFHPNDFQQEDDEEKEDE